MVQTRDPTTGQTFNDGAGAVITSAGSVSASIYGSYPQTQYDQQDGAVGTNDNDVIYESGDVSGYGYHTIENMSAGAGSCDVWVSLDGTNYAATAAAVELIDDVITGGGVKVITIPQNKTGVLKGKFKKIKVLQDGATAADARIAHGNL